MPQSTTAKTNVAMTDILICRKNSFMDLREMKRGNEEIDELDADERRDDAAEAVDEKIAAQDHGSRKWTEFHAAQRSGIRRMMMMALKITAERTAL